MKHKWVIPRYSFSNITIRIAIWRTLDRANTLFYPEYYVSLISIPPCYQLVRRSTFNSVILKSNICLAANIIDLKVVSIDERGGRVVRVYQHENLLADGPRTNTVLEYHHFASILLARLWSIRAWTMFETIRRLAWIRSRLKIDLSTFHKYTYVFMRNPLSYSRSSFHRFWFLTVDVQLVLWSSYCQPEITFEKHVALFRHCTSC